MSSDRHDPAPAPSSVGTALRPAEPTLAEGRAFARYIDVAADGIFRLLLGSAAERILAEAFAEPDHDLSHERVTFAESGEEIVGMVSSYTAEEHERSSGAPLRRAAGLRIVRMYAIAALGLRLVRFFDSVAPGDCYLQAVAVDGAHRGEGIGSLLLASVEERARTLGCARLALDVAVDNEGARRLYRRRGMVEEATSPRLLLLPRMRIVRMVKPL